VAGVIFIYSSFSLLCLFLLSDSVSVGGLFYVGMLLAFWLGCLFLVNLWLCSAHAEAPVSVSLILAGGLLQLDGYGLHHVFPILFKFGFGFTVILVVWCVCVCVCSRARARACVRACACMHTRA
jgi:NADH-ubiquinone oxidoreductase chain 4